MKKIKINWYLDLVSHIQAVFLKQYNISLKSCHNEEEINIEVQKCMRYISKKLETATQENDVYFSLIKKLYTEGILKEEFLPFFLEKEDLVET